MDIYSGKKILLERGLWDWGRVVPQKESLFGRVVWGVGGGACMAHGLFRSYSLGGAIGGKGGRQEEIGRCAARSWPHL